MKFTDLTSFPHPDPLRARLGDKNWRVYFPNGVGIDIVGGPQYDFQVFKDEKTGQLYGVDHLYGDGVSTFEVASFLHTLSLTEPAQGDLEKLDPEECINTFDYATIEQVNDILEAASNI